MPLPLETVYSTLRAEIDQRLSLRQVLLLTTLTTASTIFTLSVQGWLSSVIVLCYPLFGFFLACLYAQHDRRIGEIQAYLTEIEQGHYWEAWRRGRFRRNRLLALASRGLFILSDLFALLIGGQRFQKTPLELVALVIALLASLMTILVIQHVRLAPQPGVLEPNRPASVERIFLGGTIGINPWRSQTIIPGLLARGIPESALYNPVAMHWNEQEQSNEDVTKRDPHCLLLFVLAAPDPLNINHAISGYRQAEAIMALYDAPERTIVVIDTSQFARKPARGLHKMRQDLINRFPTAPILSSYEEGMDWMAARWKGSI